jgi:hypothetical protein
MKFCSICLAKMYPREKRHILVIWKNGKRELFLVCGKCDEIDLWKTSNRRKKSKILSQLLSIRKHLTANVRSL